MKVLLVNGSSRKKGCTNAALCEVERALQEAGIEPSSSLSEMKLCRIALPAASAGKPGVVCSMIV